MELVSGPHEERAKVVAVIVSRDRPDELAKTASAILAQKANVDLSLLIIDSSTVPPVVPELSQAENVTILHSRVNLGGAGGFALGILNAVAAGASWLWLMDDDGRPLDNGALRGLIEIAEGRSLDAVAPVVIDAGDNARFAFPYLVNGHYLFERERLASDCVLPGIAHLFNGLLIRAPAIFKVGLPDLRMFIRGDEIDFLYRMRRAGLRFGTTPSVAFAHPSSNHELFPVFNGRLHVVYPRAAWKRRNQYRNRGYNFLRNKEFILIAVDLVRYPYFFLVLRRGDVSGLMEWFGCMWRGMLGRVAVDPAIDLTPQVAIRPLT